MSEIYRSLYISASDLANVCMLEERTALWQKVMASSYTVLSDFRLCSTSARHFYIVHPVSEP